jgi:hypothetical protein
MVGHGSSFPLPLALPPDGDYDARSIAGPVTMQMDAGGRLHRG